MAQLKSWQSCPIFISSTFRDMQAERDYLRDIVFPSLAERLRPYRCHLEPVDLRWGVDVSDISAQEERELHVLNVCFAEIVRCRPFIIIILGDRFGWTPPEEQALKAITEAGFRTEVGGKSVTALEIEFGILSRSDESVRGLCYFRHPLPYESMSSEIAAIYSDEYNSNPENQNAASSLKGLKQKIYNEIGPERVKTYETEWDHKQNRVSGLEKWGEQVLADLWQEISSHAHFQSTSPDVSRYEVESHILESFIEEHKYNFAGRTKLILQLKQFALKEVETFEWCALITGLAGSGKSALFAKLSSELTTEACLLLTHAAGISTQSGNIGNMLDRWNQELARYLSLSEPLSPALSLSEKQQLFSDLLSQAAVKIRVVCLIDAINQFDPGQIPYTISWVPEIWPQNARLIVTAIPGVEAKKLEQRSGVRLYPLPLLSPEEAKEIIGHICEQHHRKLPRDVITAITTKRKNEDELAAGNPLWVSIAIEELLLLDADDFARMDDFPGSPDQRLHQLLLDVVIRIPPDVEGIYRHLLVRAEKRFGRDWTGSILTLLAVGRFGVRDYDLRYMLPELTGEPWEDFRFACFRRYFRSHIRQSGEFGQWNFRHSQLRIFIEQYYLQSSVYLQMLHQQFAEYLEHLPVSDTFRWDELMFHYWKADLKMKAAGYFGGRLQDTEKQCAARILTDSIIAGEGESPNPGLLWSIDLLKQPVDVFTQREIWHNFSYTLLELLMEYVALSTGIEFLEKNREVINQAYRKDPTEPVLVKDLAVCCMKLGGLYQDNENQTSSKSCFDQACQLLEGLYRNDPTNLEYGRDYAICRLNYGDLYLNGGEPDVAQKHYHIALPIFEHLASGMNTPEYLKYLATVYDRLGDVEVRNNRWLRSMELYEKSLHLSEKLSRIDNDNSTFKYDLGVSYERLGDLFLKLENYGEAKVFFEKALEIRKELSRQKPDYSLYLKALAVSYQRLGDYYRSIEALDEIKLFYEKAIGIFNDLYRRTPDNAVYARDVAISYEKFGDLYFKNKMVTEARESFLNAFYIRDNLVKRAPGNWEYWRELSISLERLGDIYLASNHREIAEKHYSHALRLSEIISRSLPDNMDAIGDLSVSYECMGDFYYTCGEWSKACRYYRMIPELRRKICRHIPEIKEYRRDLFLSYKKLFECYFKMIIGWLQGTFFIMILLFLSVCFESGTKF